MASKKSKKQSMTYMEKDELRKLMEVAYRRTRDKKFNRTGTDYHLGLVLALVHGMRVGELVALTANDIDVHKGTLTDRRTKGSETTTHPIRRDADVLFDEMPLLELAKSFENKDDRLFPVSRQSFDTFIKDCGHEAKISFSKLHMHSLKHSIAILIYEKNQSLGKLQTYLGHKSPGSTMAYLRVIDSKEVSQDVATITF